MVKKLMIADHAAAGTIDYRGINTWISCNHKLYEVARRVSLSLGLIKIAEVEGRALPPDCLIRPDTAASATRAKGADNE